ncbi:MAG: 30S ribosomal protein S3 [Crenarchaeota archaeon]|nr:30S ribosomal protein S3 [Thermoproteota archaeon]MCR8454936.1 30S ribosomal protein S3 [Thermoproteota archaeon]MCR8486827.1 30S ribosomal protein S3 [Thermoproteota archaeon]MCR8500727.1 30S ribosomal protein S3 [Thermoproteota archaeon]
MLMKEETSKIKVRGTSTKARVLKQLMMKFLLNEWLKKKLSEEAPLAGFVSADVQVGPIGYKIVIECKNPRVLVARRGIRKRKLIEDIKEAFGIEVARLDVVQLKTPPELNAQIVAEAIARAIERGANPRRVAYFYIQQALEKGALGVEIRVQGRLRRKRSQKMRFASGKILYTGDIAEKFVSKGYARFQLRTGTVGVQVRIVLPESLENLVDNIKIAHPEVSKDIVQELEETIRANYEEVLAKMGEKAAGEGESN